MKKEVEETVKNFKGSEEYLDRLMIEYADGFELLQNYIIKHHPDLNFSSLDILNFSSLDIEEIEKEMLTVEAKVDNIVVEDAAVDAAENVTLVTDNINLE